MAIETAENVLKFFKDKDPLTPKEFSEHFNLPFYQGRKMSILEKFNFYFYKIFTQDWSISSLLLFKLDSKLFPKNRRSHSIMIGYLIDFSEKEVHYPSEIPEEDFDCFIESYIRYVKDYTFRTSTNLHKNKKFYRSSFNIIFRYIDVCQISRGIPGAPSYEWIYSVRDIDIFSRLLENKFSKLSKMDAWLRMRKLNKILTAKIDLFFNIFFPEELEAIKDYCSHTRIAEPRDYLAIILGAQENLLENGFSIDSLKSILGCD